MPTCCFLQRVTSAPCSSKSAHAITAQSHPCLRHTMCSCLPYAHARCSSQVKSSHCTKRGPWMFGSNILTVDTKVASVCVWARVCMGVLRSRSCYVGACTPARVDCNRTSRQSLVLQHVDRREFRSISALRTRTALVAQTHMPWQAPRAFISICECKTHMRHLEDAFMVV